MNKRRGSFAGHLPAADGGRGTHSTSMKGRLASRDEANNRRRMLAEIMSKRAHGGGPAGAGDRPG